MGEHTYRHDGPKDKWYDALVAAYGSVLTAIDPADGTHEAYSPGYRPDLVALHHALDGIHHLLADVKVGNPFLKSLTQQDAPRAAAVAFAHTEEHFTENVLGRAAFTRGRPGPFRRRDNTGSRVARIADYAGALAHHHTVVPIIHEVFGGWGWRAVRLFRQMARGRADSIDAAESSWAARSFTAFHAQRISVAIHVRSAAEILRNLRTSTTELARAAHRRRERVRPGTRRCVPGAAAA